MVNISTYQGLAEEYVDGVAVPTQIGPPPGVPETPEEKHARENSHLPSYARPMDPGASTAEIHDHFAIPSPGFRVNQKFEDWVAKDVGDNPKIQLDFIKHPKPR